MCHSLVLNHKEWPEVNREKREPTKGKWAKDLNSVTEKKKTVMMNPVLRGKVLSFSIPQTMAKKALGRCKHSLQIATS